MYENQMATNAVPVLSASDKVISEMEILYDTIGRLEAKLISKFDNMSIKQLDCLTENAPIDIHAPCSQTFSNLFYRTRTCISRVESMIDYVNNCES